MQDRNVMKSVKTEHSLVLSARGSIINQVLADLADLSASSSCSFLLRLGGVHPGHVAPEVASRVGVRNHLSIHHHWVTLHGGAEAEDWLYLAQFQWKLTFKNLVVRPLSSGSMVTTFS